MKILIITDSLGLPRPFPEVVNYTETWVYMLAQKYNVHQLSFGGGTIGVLYSQIEYIKMFDPDVVIIQSGIVDCAPRAMTKFENEFFNKFWVTRMFLKLFLKPRILFFLRKKRRCTYTDIYTFEKYIINFKNFFYDKIFWIGIVPSNDKYEKLVPGITRNISKYNEVIENNIQEKFISLLDFKSEDVMSDSIHLSKRGHLLLFEKILKNIQKK